MRLPEKLTTVTPFSKALAMLCFITFPIIAFFIGTQYQQKINSVQQPTQQLTKADSNVGQPTIPVQQLQGDYFAKTEHSINTKNKGVPELGIYQTLPDKKARKIFSITGESVQILLVKSKNILLANLAKKLLVYNLTTKQSSYIFSTAKADQFIDGMALSQDEKKIAININGKHPELHVIIINLTDFSQKTFKKEMAMVDNEYGLWSLGPVFWSSSNKIYLAAILAEGGGSYRILDVESGTVTKTDIYPGFHSSNGLRLAGAQQQAPYGGCNPAKEFNIYWYDLSTGKRTTILQQSNTVFKIIRWNQNNDEILYTAQKYTPDTRQCDGAVFSTPEVYVYNIQSGKISNVNSIKEQIGLWYPQITSFFEENNTNPEGAFDRYAPIQYLGSA